jgi:hypothetical protein
MRALVQTLGPGSEWAEINTKKSRFYNAAELLFSRTLLATGPDFLDQIREFTSIHQHLADVLFEALKNVPSFSSPRPIEPDFLIGPHLSFEEATSEPRFLAALQRHSGLAELGETRDTYFERSVGFAAPFAKSLDFFDPYAASNILNEYKDTGMKWLLREKFSKLPGQLTVYTQMPDSRREDQSISALSEEAVAGRLSNHLASLSRQHPNYKVTIRVFRRARDRHDRFMRLAFEKNSISLESSKGAEIFANPRMGEAFVLHPLTGLEFHAKKSSWIHGQEPLFECSGDAEYSPES